MTGVDDIKIVVSDDVPPGTFRLESTAPLVGVTLEAVRAFRRRCEEQSRHIYDPVDVEFSPPDTIASLSASFEILTQSMQVARESLAEYLDMNWSDMNWSDMSSTPDGPLYDYAPPLHFGPKQLRPGMMGYHPNALKGWMDEIWEFTRAIPEPVRGGTFYYCPWQKKIPHGLESCGILHPGWATGTRFRTARAYRRHYRKCHG